MTVAADFLHQLYSHFDDGWLTTFAADRTTGQTRTTWAPVTDPDALVDSVTGHAGTSCVWFGVATRAHRLDNGSRGGGDDCSAIPGLWLDIDIAGPNHKTDLALPPDIDTAHDLVAAFPVPPTCIIATGGGLQPWWLFAEPLDATDATPLLARWGHTWTQRFADAGWHLDNVFDLPRIMRLPGTYNRKTDTPQPVTIDTHHWERRYGADDLDQHLVNPPRPEPSPQPAPVAAPTDVGTRPGDLWADTVTWPQLLERDGWTFHHADRDGVDYWTRPGKDKRQGHSASVNYKGGDALYVFSPSIPALDANTGYSKFWYYAATRHNGDESAAAAELRAAGFHTDDDVTAWLDSIADADGLTTPEPAATIDDPWPEPTPLQTDTPHTGDWPAGTLPDWIDEHTHAVATALQVPHPLCAQLAIGALSAITMGHADIAIAGAWTEPLVTYLVAALPPGGGKSPAYKQIVGPLHQWEQERRDKTAAARREAEADLRIAEGRLKKAEAAAANSDDGDSRATIDAMWRRDEALEALPAKFRLFASDATPEKVAVLLAEHGERIAMMSTESDLIDQAAGLYSDKVNLGVYLKAWGGEPLQVDRIKRDTIELRHPLLAVLLTVQPEHLAHLHRTGAELRNRGFFDRFMWALPQGMTGTRTFGAAPIPTTDDYGSRLTGLADQLAGWGHPVTLTMSDDATAAYGDWYNALEADMAPHAPLHSVADAISKLRSTAARVAGILHLADGQRYSDPVSAYTMARALAIGDYWLENLLTLRDLTTDAAGDRSATTEAIDLLGVIRSKGLETFTPRDLWMRVRKRYRSTEDLATGLAALANAGWCRFVEGSPSDVGTRGVRVMVQMRPESARDLDTTRPTCAHSLGRDHGVDGENARIARIGLDRRSEGNLSICSDSSPPIAPLAAPKTFPPRNARDARDLAAQTSTPTAHDLF